MNTITFNPETACIMLNNEDQTNYVDYAFINKFRYEHDMLEQGEIMNEISNIIERNEIKNVSILPMLKTHLESMINEYREKGHFTFSSVVMLTDISLFTNNEYIENKIIKFTDMYENISDHAGMPIIKELYNQVA